MKKLILPIVFVCVLAVAFGFLFLHNGGNQTVEQSNAVSGKVVLSGSTKGNISTAISTVVYRNTQYGFDFNLPDTWKGYTILSDQWKGTAAGNDKTVQSGPLISIRHPLWTEKNPRQDIPIMVFTLAQWKTLQADEFHVGAAPVNPTELGRNSRYVFALPARYNYAFPTGYEEVETILKGKPLTPTENFSK